jgi:hypothetical protein
VFATYSPELVWDGGFDERRNLTSSVWLTVSAVPARAEDSTYSASCLYRTTQSPISVDAVKIELVRACALAALPSSVSSAAIAWLEADRDRSVTKRFGSAWVTAYRSLTHYGVVVSAA